MTDDAELLRRYAEEGSEDALAEVVRRRVDLVYGAAWRQVRGNGALAEEITQAVFTELAGKAGRLARHPALVGWLHTATRFAAAKALRAESRRRAREQEAFAMNEVAGADERVEEWERLRPVIDAALGELKERERAAILLRYFEKKPLAEVGAALALTETAARSCVDRALDKLHAALVRRGITSTAAALGVALANQVSMAAPAGLAASATGAALAGVGAGAAAGGLVFEGLLGFMNTTKIMAVVAVLALGIAGWQYLEARRVAMSAAQDQAAWQAKVRGWEQRAGEAAKRADAAEADNAKLLAAVAAAKASGVVKVLEEAAPITAQTIVERLKRIGALTAEGKNEEALREYIWLLDVGMVRVPEFRLTRYQNVASLMQQFLAERANYAPAREFLRQRQGELEQQFRAGREDSPDAAQQIVDFGSINRAMKEEERTLAAFDSLPANDGRRRMFGSFVVEQLIDARRYAEAAEFRTYSDMLGKIERQEGMMRQGQIKGFTVAREPFLATMGRNFEVLAGIGALADARTLAERLFAFDGSAETRARVQQHLERAGQPGLLAGAGKTKP